VSHDASGRTDTKRERNHFLNYLGESVTRCERPDRHDKKERELFFIFFLYFNFYDFQIYIFLE